MDKKQLKRIVDNPRHIPGIHNYCDRWCERCPKTSRCSVWAMEQADESGPESRDPENEAFWNRMHNIFSTTIEMVQEYAEEHDIDLDEPMFEEYMEKKARIDKETMNHLLVTAGMSYMDTFRKWFAGNEEFLKRIAEQFESRLQMELPADNPEAECVNLYNAVEIVQWYYTVIAVKLRRAVRQILEPWELEKEIQSDSNGSAKVALIGIDRSIWAWAIILQSMPEQEKDILDFLVRLERLRRETERTFPKARAFVRPGFDEIE
jgi:hypothetical protein